MHHHQQSQLNIQGQLCLDIVMQNSYILHLYPSLSTEYELLFLNAIQKEEITLPHYT